MPPLDRPPIAADGAPARIEHRRRDVQGLRAVAVLVVIAFHAGLPVPGGFVGVDVFFVISGFVITAMLQREWTASGRIRFRAFYAQRFKRLAPALALVTTVTVLMSLLLVPPLLGPQQTASDTAVGALLLGANAVIVKSTGGYFDAPAASNPLLNTWSLSVEEQFYLAFPVLLASGWMISRRTRSLSAPVVVVSLVAAASFGLAVAGVRDPTGLGATWLGFYSPATRAWEFAVGALLALCWHRLQPRSPRSALLLGVSGAALLAVSVAVVDEGTPFPGTWALLPVAAAVLLILSGARDNAVKRTLAARGLAELGDRSYSLYLWHWPFIVLAVVLWPGRADARLLAALVSVVPAMLAYRWVEQPVRRLRRLNPRRRIGLLTGTLLVPLLVAGVVAPVVQAETRLSSFEDHSAFFSNINEQWFPCTAQVQALVDEQFEGRKRCFRSMQNEQYDVAIFGDSHAEHLFPGIASALPNKNVLALLEARPTSVSVPEVKRLVDFISNHPTIGTVVYSAVWDVKLEKASSESHRYANLDLALSAMRAPGRNVVLMEDVPRFPFPAAACAGALIGRQICSTSRAREQGNYMRHFGDLARRDPAVHLMPTRQLFCDREQCRMNPGGELLYRDENHLNTRGSTFVADAIAEKLRSIVRQRSL